MTDKEVIYQRPDGTMRIVEYYHNFFAHYAHRLEKKIRFLWWSFWVEIERDPLGICADHWAEHYEMKEVEND